MADFRIGSSIPAEGKIKLGTSNVVKIYKGSTLLWPNLPTNSVIIPCSGRIWTTVNSSETSGTVSGSAVTRPIVTNATQAIAKNNANEYAAAYFNFDSSNSHMGLFYNEWAAQVVNPPSGFRKPTEADWSSVFSDNCLSSTDKLNPRRFNIHSSALTSANGYDTSTSSPHPSGNVNFTVSDHTNANQSGLNIQVFGRGTDLNNGSFQWIGPGQSTDMQFAGFWMFANDNNVLKVSDGSNPNQNRTVYYTVNFSNQASKRYMKYSRMEFTPGNHDVYIPIRFCKDN